MNDSCRGVFYYTSSKDAEIQLESCGPDHYILFVKDPKTKERWSIVSIPRKKAAELAKAILEHIEHTEEKDE